MKVLVAGGGTAGHVSPALALARRLRDAHGAEVRFAGTRTGQEARLVPQAGFPFDPVDARPLRRDLSFETLAATVAAVRAVTACRPLVERADVVVGMGGYVSVPVGLAAARARRPLVIHEQNAVPGLANRLLARRARTVALTFGEAATRLPRRARTVLTGLPVRPEFVTALAERDALAEQARTEFGLERGRRTIVLTGGSQGALHVDMAGIDAIAILRERPDLQVLFIAGASHEHTVAGSVSPGDMPVRVCGFLERMDLAYTLADLAVARAGASTCAELSVCGLPAVLVPYPHATGGHQEANARALERAGGARVILDPDLTGGSLASAVSDLMGDEMLLRAMAERMRSWSRPDAAEALARVVLEAGEER
ncbi:MAG TPA: undecaprenyldiphospho-muramoylpentapeptide beta-N-acetylglucosaminyltransferase [Actinomycetota bacterium]|nr:undecaprenyldiphospho-muramoylpentapeptide beta-N-acetylglucosaminyltransferase [Actinomycetota bacterium]